MVACPLTNEAVCLARERTFHQISIEHESRSLALITGVKMRRDVIVVEHLDPNSKESADFRHVSLCVITLL